MEEQREERKNKNRKGRESKVSQKTGKEQCCVGCDQDGMLADRRCMGDNGAVDVATKRYVNSTKQIMCFFLPVFLILVFLCSLGDFGDRSGIAIETKTTDSRQTW